MIEGVSRRMALMLGGLLTGAGLSGGPVPVAGNNPRAMGTGEAGESAGQQLGPVDIAAALKASAASLGHSPVTGESYWLDQQTEVVLPPGRYRAGGLFQEGGNVLIRAQHPGSVIIEIPDNTYFLTVAGRVNNVFVEGLRFVGGKGAFRFTNDGVNVSGLMSFERCYFDNYTECAIGNNATDHPNLRVRDCIFMGAMKGGVCNTIGLAWGGLIDDSVIEANGFLRNRYHLKLGPFLSGSAYIVRNDFLKWGPPFGREADIWMVPNSALNSFGNNSGEGILLSSNRFGNEGYRTGESRVLIALEDQSAQGDRSSRRHATAATPAGPNGSYVSGVTICDSRVAAGPPPGCAFIKSYVSELRGWTVRNLKFEGGQWTRLVEFIGKRQGDYANLNWTVDLGADAWIGPGGPFTLELSNAPLGPVFDSSGQLGNAPWVSLPSSAGGESVGFELIGNGMTYGALGSFGGAVKTVAADGFGAPRAAVIKLMTVNSGVFLPLKAGRPDRLSWLELDLKAVAPSGCRTVAIGILEHATGVTALSVTALLTEDWLAHRFPFILPKVDGGAGWQVEVKALDYASGTSDRFAIGRLRVYHGREPMKSGHIQTLGDGRWDGEHIIMGSFHIWFDGEGKPRFKSGAPTSANDGTPMGAR